MPAGLILKSLLLFLYRCTLASTPWAQTSPLRREWKAFLLTSRSTLTTSAREPTSSYTELRARSRFSAIRYVSPHSHTETIKNLMFVEFRVVTVTLQTCVPRVQRGRCTMRRGREAKGGERTMLEVSVALKIFILCSASPSPKCVFWHSCFLFPANKSLVSSSMGSDSTFFQTLDDHITQPVLFIPETHLSSLQRIVSPSFNYILFLTSGRVNHLPDPWVPAGTRRAGEGKKKDCGKVCSGMGGRGIWCQRKLRRKIRWANFESKPGTGTSCCGLSYGGSREKTHSHIHIHTWCNRCATLIFSFARTHLQKTVRARVLFRQAGFPTPPSLGRHVWEEKLLHNFHDFYIAEWLNDATPHGLLRKTSAIGPAR